MQFGIDLGTTNSLIAVFRDGKPELVPNALGSPLTPSVVALKNDTIVIGEAAREIAISTPSMAVACFKRAMGTERGFTLGTKTFSAIELSALVLGALKADAEAHLGVQVSDVVISVPAYFNELQRQAVRAAGKLAGLNVTRLINEPTAAAMAYGLNTTEEDARALVFDLGGGTFDISIVEFFEGVMEVKASAGDAFLGGEDLTEALMRYIADQNALDPHAPDVRAQLLKLAEAAKRQLSVAQETRLKATLNLSDGKTLMGKPKEAVKEIDLTITRERFEQIAEPVFARLLRPLECAMGDARMTPDDITQLILVGGATRTPAVRSFASKKLRQLPVGGLDPDHVVALGAAVQAALAADDSALDDVVMTDVAAFTLGIETARGHGNDIRAGYFQPIIERNTVVPASREQVFYTIGHGQTKIDVQIYQGESPLVKNNLHLGKIAVTVPKDEAGKQGVRVRFTYDVSGLLEVETTVMSTMFKQKMVVTKLAKDMSEEEIAKTLDRLKAYKQHPRDDAANVHTMARLEAAYAMARADVRDHLSALLSHFDEAIDRQDPNEIGRLRTAIHAEIDALEAGRVF